MKIVGTILAGPGTAGTVGQAIGSILPFVDELFVFIDNTRPEFMGLENAVWDSLPVGNVRADVEIVYMEWPGFGPARQRALDVAVKAGAQWCLWVDADEWLDAHGEDIVAAVESCPDAAMMMFDEWGTYKQPRAIRLPCPSKWEGLTHEAITVSGASFETARFYEHPKTDAQVRLKRERDIVLLAAMIEHDPNNARWWYYLGDALEGLGRVAEAVQAYSHRAGMSGFDEEGAWACYRAACLLLFSTEESKAEEALQFCVKGLEHHSGIAELAWLAGIACYRLSRFDHAVWWAQIARVHGEQSTLPHRALNHRLLFREIKGLSYGPIEVEQFALVALGEGAPVKEPPTGEAQPT